MDIDHLFSAPKKTCRWAGEEINQLKVAEEAFFDANPGKEWATLDYLACEISHGIRFTEKPGDELEKGAYRIVGDLRNALDQAVYAASKALGAKKLKKTNFPFGESAKDFNAALSAPKGNYRDIPSQLHPKLASFKPYWRVEGADDGKDILRGLAEMANPNKHHVPLGVEIQTGMRFYGSKNVTMFGTRWDWKGKTELYRSIPGVPYEINMELEPRVAFGRVGKLGGKPVLATFHELHAMVDGIILGLEAETVRLLG